MFKRTCTYNSQELCLISILNYEIYILIEVVIYFMWIHDTLTCLSFHQEHSQKVNQFYDIFSFKKYFIVRKALM